MNADKNILVLSTWDNQGSGSAAYYISNFLNRSGYSVTLLVRDRSHNDQFVRQVHRKQASILSRFQRSLITRLNTKFSSSVLLDSKYAFLQFKEADSYVSASEILSSISGKPDIIITGLISGFVNTTVLRNLYEQTKANIYMLSVDMAPITGGCHYAWDCTGYQNTCSDCPAILDERFKNQASINLSIKKTNIEAANISLLAGSAAIQEQANRSTLFKRQLHYYVTNGCVDMKMFTPANRNIAKKVFGLEHAKKVIFCGAAYSNDPRKGFEYLIKAMHHLWEISDFELRKNTYILIASQHISDDLSEKIPFPLHIIDFIKDNRLLSLAYQASDVFVCPSVQDAGPLMVAEALACGTPVVGFDIGYMKELVINGKNGYKVALGDTIKMAECAKSILLLNADQYAQFSREATEKIEESSSERYLMSVLDQLING